MDEHKYRQKAKEIYLSLRKAGNVFSIRRFARQSEELLGKEFSTRMIEIWSTEDGWEDIQITLDRDNKEVKETIEMLEASLEQFDLAENDRDLSSYASAIHSIVSKCPPELVEDYKDRIQLVRDRIHDRYIEDTGSLSASISSTLIRSWSGLGDALSKVRLEYAEDGFDPDVYLLFGDEYE